MREFHLPDHDKLNQPLFEACKAGLSKEVTTLLDREADVNAKNDEGWTPLIEAAFWGNLAVVKLLLERGAAALVRDRENKSALMWALEFEHESIIQVLEEAEAEQKAKLNAALFRAVRERLAHEVAHLLEQSVDVNTQGVTPGLGHTPAILASRHGHTEAVRVLLEYGATVDASDMVERTALWWAAYEGHLEIARLLMDRGANVDATDQDGIGPLQAASERGHLSMVTLLLDRGASDGFGRHSELSPAVGCRCGS